MTIATSVSWARGLTNGDFAGSAGPQSTEVWTAVGTLVRYITPGCGENVRIHYSTCVWVLKLL